MRSLRPLLIWLSLAGATAGPFAAGQDLNAGSEEPGAPAPAAAPSCQAPMVPAEFESVSAYDHFVDEARVYETCMQAFIAEQRRMSAAHARAGNEAAAAFNRFAAAAAAAKPPPER